MASQINEVMVSEITGQQFVQTKNKEQSKALLSLCEGNVSMA